MTPEIKNNQTEIKGRGGRRPGAGRPRKDALEVETAGRMALMREVAALREEVGRLKRELAAARKLPVVASIDGLVHAVGIECIHGGVYGACRKIGCQPK